MRRGGQAELFLEFTVHRMLARVGTERLIRSCLHMNLIEIGTRRLAGDGFEIPQGDFAPAVNGELRYTSSATISQKIKEIAER